jgi:O-6-methylguanine DNA methyltransferase
MESTMTVPSQPALAAQAAQPGADPCDIAEAAMPDLVFGDLIPADEEWVRAHAVTCRSCATMLHGLEDVCSSLDACNDAMCESLAAHRPDPRVALGLPEARYGFMESPVGDVLVAASDNGVCEISYLRNHDPYDSLRELERRGYLVYRKETAVQPAIDQLQEYFAHERTDFSLPLDLGGVTDFTRNVLESTNTIPYGVVKTYGDIAEAIGKPRASRAVGNALGRNPIPVVIPCHRVVLSSGAMGWYTGGPEIKRTLLGIEGVRYGATRLEPSTTLPLGL